MSEFLVVFCTVPDRATGFKIAQELVDKKLAACVNITSPIESVYWWEGKIQQEPEFQLVIKTREKHFDSLERTISALHPYEVPEIMALPVIKGSQAYLKWITDETRVRRGADSD